MFFMFCSDVLAKNLFVKRCGANRNTEPGGEEDLIL